MNHIDATVFVPDPRKVTRCRGCRERIFFALTRDGRNIPVECRECGHEWGQR